MEKNHQCQNDLFLFSKPKKTFKTLVAELQNCSWGCHFLLEREKAQDGEVLDGKIF